MYSLVVVLGRPKSSSVIASRLEACEVRVIYPVHLDVRHRHPLVSVRRSAVLDEVRLVDVRRQHDQLDGQGGPHRHLHVQDQRRMGPLRRVPTLPLANHC